MRGPLARYNHLVAKGDLVPDEVQRNAVRRLDKLSRKIQATQGWSLFGKPQHPKGLYLWGGVGRGKSLLMDLFFNHTRLAHKQRVHFHQFMSDTHQAIAAWRAMDDKERKRQTYRDKKAPLDDPIPHIAKKIFQHAHLLCFDEFQVSDITDALILGRLFDGLFDLGTLIIATSNRPPDDLYLDGINRELFLPFIESLKQRLDIFHLDAAKDYRRDQLAGNPVYFHPLDNNAATAMDKAWNKVITGAKERPTHIQVRGRTLVFPRTARDGLRVSFADLCEKNLGAEDYIALTAHFATLFMDDIPQLSPEKRNQAKRFVTLVDSLYEAKTKFVCSAAVAPSDLYPKGDGSFEFSRTVSRLIEMQSQAYLATAHENK